MDNSKFKPYRQNEPMLFPPDISDLIPDNSMVRVVDGIVEAMNKTRLDRLYPGGGAPAYNPSMMLKVILFAYASGIYSSRKISQATKENINFMWLCGMQPLSHNTINRFRSERIESVFEEIFTEIVQVLAKGGYITLDTYFLDGTKIEANANKYTFVWKKSTDKYQQRLRQKVHAHLLAIDEIEKEEQKLAPNDPSGIDSETIEKAAQRINERLNKKADNKDEGSKSLKKAAKKIEKDYLPCMKKYESYQDTFSGRNSFSKTDEDATFMRMKDDVMKNGQLKAGYNIQVGSEDQFIIDATIHQRPGDTACTIDHLEHVKEYIGHLPCNIVADAGYGSEQNYTYLENEGVNAYVKHNEFFRECKRKWREDEMRIDNWQYDEQMDAYTCPEGRLVTFVKEYSYKTELGYESNTRIYECQDCNNCSKRAKCIKSKNPDAHRQIRINPHLKALKKKASEMLHTEIGSYLRKKRGIDIETVFGDIKRNYGFDRFSLRGLKKVSLEFRLVAAGHNIRKLFKAQNETMKGMATI